MKSVLYRLRSWRAVAPQKQGTVGSKGKEKMIMKYSSYNFGVSVSQCEREKRGVGYFFALLVCFFVKGQLTGTPSKVTVYQIVWLDEKCQPESAGQRLAWGISV